MDARTHCCACHCNAHCVGVVNQKTVQSQCKSGRLLSAVWRICCVIFLFLFCLCLCLLSIILSVFVSFWVGILWCSVWMQSFADCSIHFDVDIHVLLYALLLFVWVSIFCMCLCQGCELVSHDCELSTFFVGYMGYFTMLYHQFELIHHLYFMNDYDGFIKKDMVCYHNVEVACVDDICLCKGQW